MPKFLDLFAGAGGLSEGFIQAGYTPVAHVEMDVAACYTLKTRAAFHWLKANGDIELYNQYLRGEMTRNEFYTHIPQAVLNAVLNYEISSDTIPEIFEKVDQMLGGEKLDLIIGGPPCQAYSLAGRSRSETKMVGDKRNTLECEAEIPIDALDDTAKFYVEYGANGKGSDDWLLGNITVTITVQSSSGPKNIVCSRLRGEGVDQLKPGDTITVTGTIEHYYSQNSYPRDYIQFSLGCQLK